jgi:hypothetical protein
MIPGSYISSPYTRKAYPEIVSDILQQITRGVAKEKHLYEISKPKYSLEFQPVKRIVKVEGVVDGERTDFKEGTDFILSDNSMLEWIGSTKPDDKSEFRVSYTFSEPSGLTDVNPGSVLRTIVESISRELDFMYAQMDEIYKAGFIDTATGNALDLLAAIMGIQRKTPTRAMGYVSFWRSSNPTESMITGEPYLYDGREIYSLKESPVKALTSIKGIVNGLPQFIFNQGYDFELGDDNNSIKWLDGGTRPDINTPFSVDYVAYQKLTIPRGTVVSTFSTPPSSAKLFETMDEVALERLAANTWGADAQVRAQKPGLQGNVPAGAISLMPKPPTGVEHVINKANLAGGADFEEDSSLRDRTKKALEVAGRATIGALRTGLEGLEGIQSEPLIKENPECVPGIIKVVVDGGDDAEIEKVILDTRAAGIRVEFIRPKVVPLDFDLTIVLAKGTKNVELIRAAISRKIKDFISVLKIDEDLMYNRLLSAILAIEGVHDLKQMTINAYRGNSNIKSSRENIIAYEDERLYPRAVEITIESIS